MIENDTDFAERRLVGRVEKAWRSAAGTAFPRRCHIDPVMFGADWSFCFMLDLSDDMETSRFSFVGNALRDQAWPIFERQCLKECLPGSMLELAIRPISKLKDVKQGITSSGPAVHQDTEILYRCILLPLSEDGITIDGALGAIGYREIGSHQPAAPLRAPK